MRRYSHFGGKTSYYGYTFHNNNNNINKNNNYNKKVVVDLPLPQENGYLELSEQTTL